MISSVLPVHRVTATAHAQYLSLSRLLDFVCAFRCERHNRRATVEQFSSGRISLAACCQELLDVIEGALQSARLSAQRLLDARPQIADVGRPDGRC